MAIANTDKWAEYKQKLSHMLNKKRFTHSLQVADTARDLAVFWQEDAEKAALAGLLHDVARAFAVTDYCRRAEKYGIPVTDAERENPVILHAPLGAYILDKEWGIEDQEILQAVARHTIAAPDMSELDKIIFLADMIEPGRDFANLPKIRRLAYENLDEAMLLSLDCSFSWLKQGGKTIHPQAVAARKYFCDKVKEYKNKDTDGGEILSTKENLHNIIKWSQEKKATDIISIELKAITLIGDYFILMTAGNTRQGKAIADYIDEKSEDEGHPLLHMEGYDDARWILMDFGDIIVHIFQEEERKYYNLERLWGDAPMTEH